MISGWSIFFFSYTLLLPWVVLKRPIRWGAESTTQEKINGELEMKQFTAEERDDGVKQLASDYLQMALQKHWRTRSKRGTEAAGLWQRITNAAAVEAGYQPAAESVRAAMATFAVAGWAAKPRDADGRIQVIFDSFLHPAAAGTRSAVTKTRQMLYRADPYQIDLQIEFEPESDRLVVTGQLVDLSHPELVGRDVPVILSDGREFIVNTVTNQFGEFRCEVKNSGDLELSFLGRSEKPIIILLPGVMDQLNGARE